MANREMYNGSGDFVVLVNPVQYIVETTPELNRL